MDHLKAKAADKIAADIYFKKKPIQILDEIPEELKEQVLEKLTKLRRSYPDAKLKRDGKQVKVYLKSDYRNYNSHMVDKALSQGYFLSKNYTQDVDIYVTDDLYNTFSEKMHRARKNKNTRIIHEGEWEKMLKNTKTPKRCPSGYIINPVTGRCVSKTGVIGRMISKSPALKKYNRF